MQSAECYKTYMTIDGGRSFLRRLNDYYCYKIHRGDLYDKFTDAVALQQSSVCKVFHSSQLMPCHSMRWEVCQKQNGLPWAINFF